MKSAQQVVRDLLWAVNSPALLKTTNGHCCDSTPWMLQERDVRPMHLVDFMVSKNFRLGNYQVEE